MITVNDMNQYLQQEFPQANVETVALNHEEVVIRREIGYADLRPGGTVSGPALMAVADCALFVAICYRLGITAMAVTTNLNISFLRKPSADKNIIASCRLLKVGKRLAMGEVYLYSEGNEEPVAHVSGTYSLP